MPTFLLPPILLPTILLPAYPALTAAEDALLMEWIRPESRHILLVKLYVAQAVRARQMHSPRVEISHWLQ